MTHQAPLIFHGWQQTIHVHLWPLIFPAQALAATQTKVLRSHRRNTEEFSPWKGDRN